MKAHFNNILVPVDFNEQSMVALEQSFNMAKLIKLEITLLYVFAESSFLSSIFSKEQSEMVVRKIRSKLDEVAKDAEKKSRVKVNTLIAKGKVHSKIIEIAEMINAKFIVMGTRSSESIEQDDRNILGANTSKIIHSAKCPVITINSKHHYNGLRSILLPMDMTQETRQKVNAAIEMAKYFRASIKVMSILLKKGNKMVKNKLNAQLSQVKKVIEENNIKCTAEIIESTPEAKSLESNVLRYVKENKEIDLIIVMTQLEVGIVDFFISSYTQEIIRNSTIPVMSIIPKELGFTSIM